MRKDYTLGEWLETWLEYYVEPSALAPSTKACYNRAVRALPASLGSIWVIDIAPLDCLCWIQSVARTHPRAAQLDRVMLSRALLVARIALPDNVLDCIRMRPLRLSGLFYEGSMPKVYTDHHSVTQRLSLPPVTLHGLRHSVATAAVLGGEPVKLVQGCLGHASFALTADLYADHLPDTSAVCKHLFV